MVSLIMGLKGSGKTKTLVDLCNKAVKESNGDVVCIEKDKALVYDIPHKVRLVHAGEYGINSNDLLKGFISGLHAGNYDITDIFIDNFYKLLSDSSDEAVVALLDWMNTLSIRENVNFVISATASADDVCDEIKKYFIEF